MRRGAIWWWAWWRSSTRSRTPSVTSLGGQTIGIGAGQQSRVDCTKLAGAKADVWHLGRSPMVLDLAFRRGVRRQDRINWRVRYIEGDLTAAEEPSAHWITVRP